MSYPGTFLHACKDTWQPPRHGPPQSLWERGSQSLTLPSLGEELHVGDSLYLRFSRNNMSEASGRLRGLRDTMPEGLSWEIREKLRQKRKGSQSSPRLKDCSFSCGRHAFSPPPPSPQVRLAHAVAGGCYPCRSRGHLCSPRGSERQRAADSIVAGSLLRRRNIESGKEVFLLLQFLGGAICFQLLSYQLQPHLFLVDRLVWQ